MFDLNDVAIFVQVIREGSFAAAGRHLGIPANTVSRRVQQLENSLATRLMQRSTRKLSLTAAGHAFFEYSMAGITQIEQARQTLLDASREPSGSVRVAAPVDFFEHFPIAAIAAFLARYQRVQLVFALSDERTDLIGEAIDVAFRSGELSNSSLVARKLAENHLCLVASPAYLDARGMPTELVALAEHACLVRSSQSNQARWRLTGPAGWDEVRVTGRFAANTVQSLLRAARAGLGIALLPSVLVGADLAEQRLAAVLPDYRQELGGIYVVYPSRHQRSLAVSALVEFVEQWLTAQGCGYSQDCAMK